MNDHSQELKVQNNERAIHRVGAAPGSRNAAGRVLRMRPCALRKVWAVASPPASAAAAKAHPRANQAGLQVVRARCRSERRQAAPQAAAPATRPAPELAFYRRHTEALLRRYMRLSVQSGRVPSLLGRELFQGNVSTYRVSSFEDVVLFCVDVERCLGRLDRADQAMISRVALQRYTQGEAAGLLGVSLSTVVRGYAAALDRVTAMLVKGGLLVPLESCQEGRPVEKLRSR